MFASVLAVLAVLSVVTWGTLRREYQIEVREILSASDRTALKLASRTAEVFDSVNKLTLLIKYLDDRKSLPPLGSLREAGVISDDLVQFVHVSDRRGFITDTTARLSAANVADEDFFKRHRSQSDVDVSIAPVWTDPINATLGIPVTRRLAAGPDADFKGLVTATVNPAALSVAYARTEDKGTAIGVLGSDGIFRSRTVDGKLSFGERADPVRIMARAVEVRLSGVPIVSPIDGASRFLSAVKVDRYPLYAVVAIDATNALAVYRGTRAQVLTWAAVFAAGTLLSGWIVLMQVRRLEASRLRARTAEAAIRATLEGSLDAVAILSAVRSAEGVLIDLQVTDCNKLAAMLVGREGRQELLGQRLCELVPTMTAYLPHFDRCIREQRMSQSQVLATDPHLVDRWLHHQVVPLENGIALITRDVTDKCRADQALEATARCDGLTKLANRRHFDEMLEAARARAMRSGEAMALMYIDLDGFKAVNDTLGHAAGDEVLIEVARRLKAVMRETDAVARLGGDEFVVLAERAGSVQEIREVCERILASLQAPHALSGELVMATPSVGVAIFDNAETPDALCARADAAMYLAKSSGKSRYVMANASTERRSTGHEPSRPDWRGEETAGAEHGAMVVPTE